MKNVITKENKDFNDRFCVVDTFRSDNNVFNVMMGILKTGVLTYLFIYL